jgi:sterol desaturase/sphingolipid hydroxylase (fatty acid hydroxylase superfamily)
MNSFLQHYHLVYAAKAAALFALLVAIFVPLERLFALHPTNLWRKQVGVDLGWYFLNSLVVTVIIAVPVFVLTTLLRGADPGGFYSTVASWPIWVTAPLSLLVADFGSYWGHRAFHAVPFLWRFHAIHHSAEHMDWLVNTRSHPIDVVLTRLSGLIPLYFLGLAQASPRNPGQMVLLVSLIGTVWTYFIHANVRCRLGPLEWLISTPAFHHWHHTNDEHRDKNFAAMFPWIDRIFGTSWLPNYWPPEYGIDAKTSHRLMDQLLDPIFPPAATSNTASTPSQTGNSPQPGQAMVPAPSSMSAPEVAKKTGI